MWTAIVHLPQIHPRAVRLAMLAFTGSLARELKTLHFWTVFSAELTY